MWTMAHTSRVAGRTRLALVAATWVIGAAVLAGCSESGARAPADAAGAGSPATGAAVASAGQATGPTATACPTPAVPATGAAVVTPGPTEVPGPPVASLEGGAAGIVPGELGTFLWDGLGSDAPWLVPPGSVPAAAGAPLAVTLDPALAPRRWTARWARVTAGTAGDPATVITGDDAAIGMAAPAAQGPWGLQVEITFAAGRRAAWYWSLSVGP